MFDSGTVLVNRCDDSVSQRKKTILPHGHEDTFNGEAAYASIVTSLATEARTTSESYFLIVILQREHSHLFRFTPAMTSSRPGRFTSGASQSLCQGVSIFSSHLACQEFRRIRVKADTCPIATATLASHRTPLCVQATASLRGPNLHDKVAVGTRMDMSWTSTAFANVGRAPSKPSTLTESAQRNLRRLLSRKRHGTILISVAFEPSRPSCHKLRHRASQRQHML